MKNLLKDISPGSELTIAGSYRRKKKDSGDIDILLRAEDQSVYEKFIERLIKDKYICETLAHGQKKFMGLSNINPSKFSNRRIDIMYTSPEEYPFAVLYFTGSAELITDISSTGETLKANNLRVLKDGEILKSQACIFTSKKNSKKKGLKKLIQLLSK